MHLEVGVIRVGFAAHDLLVQRALEIRELAKQAFQNQTKQRHLELLLRLRQRRLVR